MSIPTLRPPRRTGRTGQGDDDGYSPAFAAWALLLTLSALTVVVVAVWLLAAWAQEAP